MERSKSFERKFDAERWVLGQEGAKQRGDWIDPTRPATTTKEWAERWATTWLALKPKTRAGYDSLLRTHVLPTFGDVPLGKIDHVRVQSWVASLVASGLSPARTRQAYQTLHALLRNAVRSGYLSRSPAEGIELPRPVRREMLFLTGAQVEGLAEVTAEPYPLLVYLLAYGGLRWGEAVALRRGRVQIRRIQVRESLAEVGGSLFFGETKTYRVRTVALPAFLAEMLAHHLQDHVGESPEALVFTAPDGGPVRHSNFRRRVWLPAVAAAGLPNGFRIHDLRHTCAALLISQGAHPKAIQTHLGHSSIQVTLDRYGHLFPDDMERLADGLDETRRLATAARERPDGGPVPQLTSPHPL